MKEKLKVIVQNVRLAAGRAVKKIKDWVAAAARFIRRGASRVVRVSVTGAKAVGRTVSKVLTVALSTVHFIVQMTLGVFLLAVGLAVGAAKLVINAAYWFVCKAAGGVSYGIATVFYTLTWIVAKDGMFSRTGLRTWIARREQENDEIEEELLSRLETLFEAVEEYAEYKADADLVDQNLDDYYASLDYSDYPRQGMPITADDVAEFKEEIAEIVRNSYGVEAPEPSTEVFVLDMEHFPGDPHDHDWSAYGGAIEVADAYHHFAIVAEEEGDNHERSYWAAREWTRRRGATHKWSYNRAVAMFLKYNPKMDAKSVRRGIRDEVDLYQALTQSLEREASTN